MTVLIPALAASATAFFGLFSRRVHHGGQTDEGEIIFIIQREGIVLLHFLDGKGEDTESVLGKCLVLLQDLFSVGVGHLPGLCLGHDIKGSVKKLV